jgi:peroxiredoxin Q/BCP
MRRRRRPLLTLALAALPALLAAQEPDRPTAMLSRGPDIGQRAPDFSLPWATKDRVGAEPFSLSRALGQVVVVAFYPRDFTKSCTAEWQAFAAQRDSLFGPDVVVVGISTDSIETHQRFAKSLDLPYMLLSDPEQAVSRRYGANGGGGVNRRAVFVIGKDGKVVYRDSQFAALDPSEYAALRRAVGQARR